MLTLPGHDGPVNIEFIVDTAFDGDLSVPPHVLARLDVGYQTDRLFQMADGRQVYQPAFEINLLWDGEIRLTEVVSIKNASLLGIQLMDGKLLQAEMTDGGEVSLEDL